MELKSICISDWKYRIDWSVGRWHTMPVAHCICSLINLTTKQKCYSMDTSWFLLDSSSLLLRQLYPWDIFAPILFFFFLFTSLSVLVLYIHNVFDGNLPLNKQKKNTNMEYILFFLIIVGVDFLILFIFSRFYYCPIFFNAGSCIKINKYLWENRSS